MVPYLELFFFFFFVFSGQRQAGCICVTVVSRVGVVVRCSVQDEEESDLVLCLLWMCAFVFNRGVQRRVKRWSRRTPLNRVNLQHVLYYFHVGMYSNRIACHASQSDHREFSLRICCNYERRDFAPIICSAGEI